VARAKRTDRAEARRRYREATVATTDIVDDATEAPAVPEAALPRDARERRSASTERRAGPPQRQGFAATLRAAAAPADIRGDLRAFPSIVLRSKAALVPGLVIVGTAAALFIPALASNQIVVLAGNVILQPPPMIIAFLAGMLAPRAAWLMGGLMAVLAGLAYVIVVTVNTDSLITPLGFTYVVTTSQKVAYAQSVLLSAPVFGIAVGAFAGFYRRFLNMSSPQREASRRR
jgi:hypothetical protein